MANYDDYDARPSRHAKLKYPEDSDDDLRGPPHRSSKTGDRSYRKDPKAAKYGARDYGDPRDIEPRGGSDSDNRKGNKLRSGVSGGKGGLTSRRDDFGDDEDDGFVKIPKRSSPKRYADEDDAFGDDDFSAKPKAYSRGKGKDSFDDDPPPRKNETRKRDTKGIYGLDDDDDDVAPIRRSRSTRIPRDHDPYDDLASTKSSSRRKDRGYYDDDYDDAPSPPRRSRTHRHDYDRDDYARDKGYRSDGQGMRSARRRGGKDDDYDYDDRDRDRPRYSDRDRARDRGYHGGGDRTRRGTGRGARDYDDYDDYDTRRSGRGYRSLDEAPTSRSSRKYRDVRDDDRDYYGSSSRRARDRDRDRSRDRDRYSKSKSRKSGGLKLDMDSLGRYYQQGQKHYRNFKPLVDGMAKLYLDSKKT